MKRIRDFGDVGQLAKAEQFFAEVISFANVGLIRFNVVIADHNDSTTTTTTKLYGFST